MTLDFDFVKATSYMISVAIKMECVQALSE